MFNGKKIESLEMENSSLRSEISELRADVDRITEIMSFFKEMADIRHSRCLLLKEDLDRILKDLEAVSLELQKSRARVAQASVVIKALIERLRYDQAINSTYLNNLVYNTETYEIKLAQAWLDSLNERALH